MLAEVTRRLDGCRPDRSFVAGLPGHPAVERLVKTVVELAADLGIEVIAEGVETRAQLDALEAMGCCLAQGYLLSRPLPPAVLPPHLQSTRRAR